MKEHRSDDGALTANEREALTAWVRDNATSLSGWSTWLLDDDWRDVRERYARLVALGVPVRRDHRPYAVVSVVHGVMLDVRAKHRRSYRKIVADNL